MDARPRAIDSSLPAGTHSFVEQRKFHANLSGSLLISCRFRSSCFSPFMPEHGFAKDQPEWHFVDQCFQRAGARIGAGKICMRPSPEVAMPVSTVVSLNSEPQRVPLKTPAIQRDPAGKKRVGMRGSRESNPALVAQRDAKRGTIMQSPMKSRVRQLPTLLWQELSSIPLLPIRKWNGFCLLALRSRPSKGNP